MAHLPEEHAVAAVNEQFYAALSSRELSRMEAVWLPVDWAECVHPGWTPLHGWTQIRESWCAIFRSPTRTLVQPTDVHVRVLGDIAWVSCLERVSMVGDTHLDTQFAHATNIFVRRSGAWRLVVHHASPVPTDMPTMWGGEPGTVN